MRRKKKKIHHRTKNKVHKKTHVLHIRMLLSGFFLVLILGGALFIRQNSNQKLRTASDPRSSLQIGTFPISQTPTPTVPGLPPHLTPFPTTIPVKPTTTPAQSIPIPTSTSQTPMCIGNSGEPLKNAPACRCDASIFFECKNQKCVRVISENYGGGTGQCKDLEIFGLGDECNVQNITGKKDGYFCIGKPVIYLYPEKPTLVDVSVRTSGQIVVSDPHYPTGGPASPGKPASLGGWKDVLAEPDGRLTYQGKNYTELFYESNVADFEKPTTGLTIDIKNVRGELDILITKLGLIKEEKTEFLDWWVPRLQALNSKYIFFSVIEASEKEKIDHVTYSPKPQTRIEFLAYFKKLDRPFEGKLLDLPATPPQRIGFTAVEWGGILDSK